MEAGTFEDEVFLELTVFFHFPVMADAQHEILACVYAESARFSSFLTSSTNENSLTRAPLDLEPAKKEF